MQIAELIAPRRLRLAESVLAEPGPGQVQMRVDAVGICGSDLHSYKEGGVGDTPCHYPMVLGHEPAGTVVRAGPGVAGWQPGDRAALEPALYCYHCEFCHAGQHNVCANLRFMSMPGEPGFFRQFANVPAANLVGIPSSLSAAEATLVEPLAVVLHSMKFAAPRPGETAVVFGGGPIGLLTAMCLKLGGASRVWCMEPVTERREMALRAGADAAMDPFAEDPVRQILRDTRGRGVDMAIDCAAAPGTINQCIHVTRNAGRIVITGIPVELEVPLEFSPMRRKELTLFNVRRSNHESNAARDLLLQHRARLATLITHRQPLSNIANAFEQVEHYAGGVGKLVILPHPEIA